MYGFLVGTFGLIALEVFVSASSSPAGAQRVGGLLETVANGVRNFLSPAYPGLPAAAKGKAAYQAAVASGAATAAPIPNAPSTGQPTPPRPDTSTNPGVV